MKALAFFDFLDTDETERVDWVTILAWSDITCRATFSVLLHDDLGSAEQVLSSHEWDVNISFSQPTFDNVLQNSWDFDDRVLVDVNGLRFRALYHNINHHGYWPSEWRLSDQLVLFYRLFFDRTDHIWKRIDDDGVIHSVVREKSRDGTFQIDINMRYLKDFLSATHTVLLRLHHWGRKSMIEPPAQLVGRALFQISEPNKNYRIWVDHAQGGGASMWSVLLGKDIIRGYNVPPISLPEYSYSHRVRKYEEFIIGEEDGSEVVFTCDGRYFAERGKNEGNPGFLTPIFFRRGVLQKYINEPRRFTVSMGHIACLSLWSLSYDDQNPDHINVWLGDLSSLPYEEQKHWRSYNILPTGHVSKHRFRTQLLAEWIKPINNVVYDFENAFDQLQASWSASFGRVLFLPLSEPERYLEALHLPVNEDLPELDRFLQSLSKRLCDSIDVTLLGEMDATENGSGSDKGSLQKLRTALHAKGYSKQAIDVFVGPMEILQSLRSSGSAHRRGQRWQKLLTKFNLIELSNQQLARELVKRLTDGFLSMFRQLDDQ